MARERGRPGMGEWVRSLGEQIGNELGQVIAQSVQRTLESSIDVADLARRLGAGIGRRGRKPAGARALCGEAGCGRPVLAKGLLGIVFPLAPLALYILIRRDWSLIRQTRPFMGMAIILLVVVALTDYSQRVARPPQDPSDRRQWRGPS